MSNPPSRLPLHERTDSQGNTRAGIRLVPRTPPRLLGVKDDIYTRTPLPTHPSHILSPPGHARYKGSALDDQFQQTTKADASPRSPVSTAHPPPQLSQNGSTATGATGSPSTKPKTISKKHSKKRLQVHKDNKTFSLLQDDPRPTEEEPISPTSPLEKVVSPDSLLENPRIAAGESNSTGSCVPEEEPSGSSVVPATPSSSKVEPSISADPITNSPWNYQLVGGVRKVPKTPEQKLKSAASQSSLPPLPHLQSLPETSDGLASHDLSTKPSFRSTETATTTSENSNYKVYGETSDSAYEVAPALPSSSDSNYRIIGDASSTGSVIHRPQTAPERDENCEVYGDDSFNDSVIHRPHTAISESENYEIYGSSFAGSIVSLVPGHRYSQESLIVPPLKPRTKRSTESLGYYKQRSRETLRTNSLTSLSTVLSQREASRAIVGTGSIIQLPIPSKAKASGSWAEPSTLYPPRSHMNEHPHQWSSQLSTVLSESDGGTERGTDRGSQSWSDNGRRSSGMPSSLSHNSQRVLSISSSLAEELALDRAQRSRPDSSITPPPATLSPHRRHLSANSARIIADQDEHGDGITDMQELRTRPSRPRISVLFGSSSSDTGRTSTMRSHASTRSNRSIANSIPQWAKVYYGSGERRYLGAPGSSTEGTESRTSSFRSGSPNTDHFPLSIYSPRRRPQGVSQENRPGSRGSMEITPIPPNGDRAEIARGSPTRRGFRTWSMSSVWSPHLRLDRRATRRSVWEPPSVNWSTEGGMFGRRNVQIVMFITGFLFPFSWMLGALLPLPVKPVAPMQEDHSTSNLDETNDSPNDYLRQFGPMDESRYESAKWWRRLNRWMSLAGVLIIAAIVVLVVIGLKERW